MARDSRQGIASGPRPLVVVTGQGLARADGVNLARRIASLEPVTGIRPSVEWRRRRDLDALVTAGACELITRGVPVHADEIEALMRA